MTSLIKINKKHNMKNLFLTLIIGIVLTSCNSDNFQIEEEQLVSTLSREPVKIQFLSLDSLLITANLYDRGSEYPVIVLCHQARYNKFEYNEIAKTLFDKGYNCLAIDQRSGGPIVETFNETFLEADKKGLSTEFLDAEQDIIAAIDFAYEKYNKKVILWGSSYSSTLSLHIACDYKKIDAVIAFSPGDYFDEEKGGLANKLNNLKMPMFVTSSKEEAPYLSNLLDGLNLKENQMQFIPSSDGRHGSRALWKTDEDNEEYWEAILKFLSDIKTDV